MNQSMLWRGVYAHGHEACRLYEVANEWRLEGTAVFISDDHPCHLSYLIACDSSWNTVNGTVSGWLGNTNINVELSVDVSHQWQMNGVKQPAVQGCLDLDLNFSPATNLLPIRRLGLAIGEEAQVNAAWLRFPSFELEPLPQVYARLDEFTYRYSSNDGKFIRDLKVNDVGFVTDYPGLWQAET
jgi:uncharacterized protein